MVVSKILRFFLKKWNYLLEKKQLYNRLLTIVVASQS